MPLSRYLIRNEFGLAEPELYKAAERDGSEALLQGVAMAGLVGVLRQLGDLAEFAAEIFHDLHEEVTATAARGHGLMARVQQLEADFPSTEKALLSQTSHSPFFSAPGIEWHPNLHPEQYLVTLGDLPRFVMGSYEECRGPPRLFLLDKFDVAGAGACLKRYTDPSFFKVEARSPELATYVQREKKTREVKKKGARMRNGETPKNAPPFHAKLHQLLQEECSENGFRDPARVVKLKKRQLNGYPFDSETGKSYMEKFVETPSPEHKLVCEVTFHPPCLNFRSDNISETTIDVLEINTVSAVRKSLQGNVLTCSPPYAPEEVIESSIEELREEIIYRASETPSELFSSGDTYTVPSNLPDVMYKNKYAVNGEGGKEDSLDGYPSDDVTRTTENYMDALTKVKSDMETDNEHRTKSDMGFYNHGIREQLELMAYLSDSHSIGNASASEDGNSSFKRERSTFYYTDTSSNLAGETPSHGDGADKGPSSNYEACIAESMETSLNQLSSSAGVPESNSDKLQVLNDLCTEGVKILDTRETSCGLAESVETWCGCTISCNADETGASMTDSSVVCSSIPLQNRDHALFSSPGETHVGELHNGDLDVISDAPLHLSHVSEIRHEKQRSDYCVHEMLKVTDADKYYTENSAHSVSTTEEPLSVLQEVDLSSETSLENMAPMVDVQQPLTSPDQQSFSLPNVQQLDDDSAEAGRSYVEEKTIIDDISKAMGGQETGGHICNVDGAVREAIPFELPCNHLNYEDDEDEVNNDRTMETVEAEDVAIGLRDSSHSIFGVNHPAMDLSDSGMPLFGIFPEANKGHGEMPPLPPVQWRMGKARSALLDSMRELSSAANEKVQLGFSGGELIQSNSNPFSPELVDDDANCCHDPVSPKESLMHPPNQLAPVIAEDVKVLQHTPKDVERQGDNVENEHPQTGLSTSGGEIACHSKTSVLVSLFEVPKPNGHSTMRLPRPRSPLIEAPDKSKLRKVTDRVRPGIEPKVDERDTLLELIRAKSFNLKPAVVTRPSIEGPKTNLKVVAIVEKANAIRQALVGSDDDDDEDSWSDS